MRPEGAATSTLFSANAHDTTAADAQEGCGRRGAADMVRRVLVGPLLGILGACAVNAASPYDVDPSTDLTLTLGMFGVVGIEEAFVKPTLAGGHACPLVYGGDYCDKSKLNALDRTVVGNDSATWRNVSDVGEYSGVALPIVASAVDAWLTESDTPVVYVAKDSLVILESVAAATFATDVIKLSVRRPRPAQYVPGRSVSSVEEQLSFPSGHTSAAASGFGAYTTTFWLRHPDSPERFVVLGAAILATGLTAYGRVGGGMHFYTDVIAGAILGGAIGYLVPMWHRAGRAPALSFEALPGGAAAVWRTDF